MAPIRRPPPPQRLLKVSSKTEGGREREDDNYSQSSLSSTPCDYRRLNVHLNHLLTNDDAANSFNLAWQAQLLLLTPHKESEKNHKHLDENTKMTECSVVCSYYNDVAECLKVQLNHWWSDVWRKWKIDHWRESLILTEMEIQWLVSNFLQTWLRQ